MLFLLACGTPTDTDKPADTDPGTTPDTICTASGFQPDPTVLTLPDLNLADDEAPFVDGEAGGSFTCAVGGENGIYTDLVDLTGDGRLDIVVTEDVCLVDAIGKTTWRVFAGTETGFADGVDWALPDGGFDDGDRAWFSTDANLAVDCAAGGEGTFIQSLLDMDGDGQLDLLVTQNGCLDETIGQDHWLVYPGTGAGFGAAETLALPAASLDPADTPWSATAGTRNVDCSTGDEAALRFTLAELDGDGRPDLVVTQNPCDDAAIGDTVWRVYRGQDGGFAAAEDWAVPALGALDEPWSSFAPADVLGCEDGGWAEVYAVARDVTGDSVADLVLTQDDCLDGGLGQDHWWVYPGNGAGFGDKVEWPLPDVGIKAKDTPWNATASAFTRDCTDGGTGVFAFSLMDVTRDAIPDVLVTQSECDDAAVGQTVWRVYPGTGAGFDAPQDWAMPEVGVDVAGAPWQGTTSEHPQTCDDGTTTELHYQLVHADGDGLFDVLLTADACLDATLGTSTWWVFAGAETCAAAQD